MNALQVRRGCTGSQRGGWAICGLAALVVLLGAGVAAADEGAKAVQAASENEVPDSIDAQLNRMRMGAVLRRRLDEIERSTNLRFGLANTIVFQQASGGDGERSAAAGDFDLLLRWNPVASGTPNAGSLFCSAEYRYQIGSATPASLGNTIGALIPTVDGFGERPIVLKELYWEQRLLDGKFRLGLGRIDLGNLFGSHRLQSASSFFLHQAFSGLPTSNNPGPGLGAAAQATIRDWLFVSGGVGDANGKATTARFASFFEDGELLTFAEIALLPLSESKGVGRYRFSYWHRDAGQATGRPAGRGVTLSCDQDLGERIVAFARYGRSAGDLTDVRQSVQFGGTCQDFIVKDAVFGLAAAWAEPTDRTLRSEKIIEAFQRFQFTESLQFTIGVQGIFDPSNAPNDNVLGVLSLRLRVSL